MKLSTLRAIDALVICFFVVHIPVSILVDFQTVLPAHIFPGFARQALEDYIRDYKDVLVASNPAWFQALTYIELVVHFPFFFAAIWAYTMKERWIRIPSIVYGCCALTAVVPILTEVLLAKNPANTKLALAGFYSPFAVMPVIVLARALPSPDMFSTVRKHDKWM